MLLSTLSVDGTAIGAHVASSTSSAPAAAARTAVSATSADNMQQPPSPSQPPAAAVLLPPPLTTRVRARLLAWLHTTRLALAHRRRCRLRRGLAALRAHLEARTHARRTRIAHAFAADFFRRQRALERWQRFVAHRCVARSQISAAQKICARSALHAAFHFWRAHWRSRRREQACIGLALAHWANATQTGVWERWRAYVRCVVEVGPSAIGQSL